MIRNWYMKQFPTDDMGQEISASATWRGLFETLDRYKDVYEYLCVGDSIIRERVFEQLAKIIKMPYSYIYDQWLLGA